MEPFSFRAGDEVECLDDRGCETILKRGNRYLLIGCVDGDGWAVARLDGQIFPQDLMDSLSSDFDMSDKALQNRMHFIKHHEMNGNSK